MQQVSPGDAGQSPQDGGPVTGAAQTELPVLGDTDRGHTAPVLPGDQVGYLSDVLFSCSPDTLDHLGV